MPVFDLALARAVIPAEIGAEIQGTWVNIIGRGAAGRVEKMIKEEAREREWLDRIDQEQLETRSGGKKQKRRHVRLRLTNGWTITFADEPDVAIRDTRSVLRSAIEIKGSLDKAGAQTRYGEAKKSFSKALKEHAQCETIYLASCFTDAVREQIDSDAYVRKTFNLVDIFAEDRKKAEFLYELFVHIIRIARNR
jgi:hypothetical protein